MSDLNRTLSDVLLLDCGQFEDKRGVLWSQDRFGGMAYEDNIVLSVSHTNVLRGVHAQHGMSKIVHCAYGSICDVVVDLRPQSDTFGQHERFLLHDGDRRSIYVPDGFGHGFYVLNGPAVVVYKLSCRRVAEDEYSVLWDDMDLNIHWGIDHPIAPIVSAKDMKAPTLRDLRERLLRR